VPRSAARTRISCHHTGLSVSHPAVSIIFVRCLEHDHAHSAFHNSIGQTSTCPGIAPGDFIKWHGISLLRRQPQHCARRDRCSASPGQDQEKGASTKAATVETADAAPPRPIQTRATAQKSIFAPKIQYHQIWSLRQWGWWRRGLL